MAVGFDFVKGYVSRVLFPASLPVSISLFQLEHDPEEELAVLDQLIEWQRQTGEYGDAAK